MDEKFIRIPADFKSLHDLKELVSNYDFLSRLNNALNGYQRHYVNSYLMSLEEVLKYIPHNQHEDYKVFKRGKQFKEYGKKSKLDKLLKETVPGKEKIFLLNTIDRKIDVCYWAGKNPGKWNKGDPSYNVPHSSVTYSDKIDFVIDEESKNLHVLVYYSYTEHQSVGGHWINGRKNGYLSGNYNLIPYTINGHEVYKFCTKTNKYLGYFGFKQDPTRPWQEIKSRY
jgi:hypothetical protein